MAEHVYVEINAVIYDILSCVYIYIYICVCVCVGYTWLIHEENALEN